MVEISNKRIDGKLYSLLTSYPQKGEAMVNVACYRYNDGGHRRLARVIKDRNDGLWDLWVCPNEGEESK